MSKTLFVSDLDGTLLQPDAKLSETTVTLLNESLAKGKIFTVATARTPATVSPILKDIKLPVPAIVMTGAAFWNQHTNRYSHLKFMNPEAVTRLVDTFHATGFPIYLFTIEDALINIYHVGGGKLSDLERQFMEERIHSPYKRFHIDPEGAEIMPESFAHTILFYGMQPDAFAKKAYAEVVKIPDVRPQFYYDIYGPEIGIVEAFSPEATKANAVKELASHVGADRIVAFGDNINDIPMLKVADVAVAVENALPEVKEVADIVIGPNTSDAVARFIAEFDS